MLYLTVPLTEQSQTFHFLHLNMCPGVAPGTTGTWSLGLALPKGTLGFGSGGGEPMKRRLKQKQLQGPNWGVCAGADDKSKWRRLNLGKSFQLQA